MQIGRDPGTFGLLSLGQLLVQLSQVFGKLTFIDCKGQYGGDTCNDSFFILDNHFSRALRAEENVTQVPAGDLERSKEKGV